VFANPNALRGELGRAIANEFERLRHHSGKSSVYVRK
jgi:hypothetical protein